MGFVFSCPVSATFAERVALRVTRVVPGAFATVRGPLSGSCFGGDLSLTVSLDVELPDGDLARFDVPLALAGLAYNVRELLRCNTLPSTLDQPLTERLAGALPLLLELRALERARPGVVVPNDAGWRRSL